ncbi:protein kinase and PP2C-like domain-containing protein isoform X2 [Gastrolobium bilobum]|uniref:protein kinase and PP2C-like domain-containing protein isoform X2 n=1 Tax=Gastrolobium bilobum TaxID=150636 RepID=UPI002AB1331D|nr:protein kinase and PP2C-like domain-containing protein isoform X2 [Gastrolobium bilobum]
MVIEIVEPNTCIRGCCTSSSIPLHLPPSSYTLLSPIARGAESVVYEGTLDGKKVAVKKPILSISEDINKFHKELQLLCKLDHPGIATLIAAHAKPPNYMFFFKLYESANLAQKLHVEEWIPTINHALMITMQLALALQYLHNLGIVHRDVKPANILLDENLRPHLTDFGLAEYKNDLKGVSLENWKSSGKPTGGFHKKNMVGTLIYMAPEILRKELHTEKSDVYSFGVSINELLTGVVPYTDLRAEAQAHTVLEMNYTEQQLTAAVVSDGLRPVLATEELGIPSRLLSMIQKCWDTNPKRRPSFDDIVKELDFIMEHRTTKKAEDMHIRPCNLHVDQLVDETSYLPACQESINWSTQGELFARSSSSATDSCLRTWRESYDDPLVYHPTLSWGSYATCGRRETMEDTHFVLPHICNENDVYAFGIFDGHRGAAAAEFSSRAVPAVLQTLDFIGSPANALVEAFLKTDAAFRKELDSFRKTNRCMQKDWHPGCTAIAALVVRNKLFVANIGDCRAILCRAGNSIALSKDHVASCLEERERVIRHGGHVHWQVDTWRVGLPALQVTRSIGDDDLKPAVTAEPEIAESTLCAEDEFLVMASDGLWDVISSMDVINIIKNTVKEPGMCSKRLATEAVERGSKDNITVIVVFLRPVSTAERIY